METKTKTPLKTRIKKFVKEYSDTLVYGGILGAAGVAGYLVGTYNNKQSARIDDLEEFARNIHIFEKNDQGSFDMVKDSREPIETPPED